MIRVRQKLFVLLASFLLTLAVALAASHHPTLRRPLNESRFADRTVPGKSPRQEQSQLDASQAVGPIDRNVTAGGGGASSGGNIRVDGTIAEVSASKTMSGGAFTLTSGFLNTPPSAPSGKP